MPSMSGRLQPLRLGYIRSQPSQELHSARVLVCAGFANHDLLHTGHASWGGWHSTSFFPTGVNPTMTNPHLSIRLDFANGDRIGPGKIALLEAIHVKGSISAAPEYLGMSYRRETTVWPLLSE